MKFQSLLSLAALGSVIHGQASKPRTVIEERHGERLRKRVSCGAGVGSCLAGQCCSGAGYCGTAKTYCQAPQCQIAYSDTKCDASQKPKGQNTKAVTRNRNGPAPYDRYITTCSSQGLVALTFDDGPYDYTTQVLDVLKANNVKATFFVNGNNIGKGPIDTTAKWVDILRRMYNEGHHIASHSWSHQDLSASSQTIREQQIIYNEMAAFRNIFGWFPKYLRPPYGTCSRDSGCLGYVTSLGYHVVNWNLDTKDFENNTPGTIGKSKTTFSNALAAGNPSANSFIVLNHDTQQQTAASLLPYMIQEAKKKGYKLVTVGECLGDPKSNWYVDTTTSM